MKYYLFARHLKDNELRNLLQRRCTKVLKIQNFSKTHTKKKTTLRCIRTLYVTEYIYFNCMSIVVTQYNHITPVETERYTQFTLHLGWPL